MVRAGAVGWDTYARTAAKAVSELEKAHGLQDIRLAGAVRAGTTEAYSAVLRSTREGDARSKESPQDRVARVLMESKEIEKQQLEQLRRVADALRNSPTFKEVVIQ